MALGESLCDAGPPPPCPSPFSLASHALWADQPGAKVALTVAGPDGAALQRWRYDELRGAVSRRAGGLIRAGLRPGDRVAIRLGDSADFPVAFLAVIAAGGVAAPTSTMLTAGELDRILDDLDARLLIGAAPEGVSNAARRLDPAELDGAAPIEPRAARPDDPAFVIFTSGSSGRPKGVLHAHRSAWARRMMWEDWYGLRADDVMLHAGAFNWTYTLGAGLLDPWAAGASAVVHAGPRDPGVWPRIAAAQGATLFAATPGVYRQLLKYGEGVGAGFAELRHGLSAGEALAPSTRADWERETGKPVYEALGMSEISTYCSACAARPPRPRFAGPPQRGRRVAVLESGTDRPAPLGSVGELAVSRRDPGLMLGYWRDEAATAAAFRGEWFLTGDLAEMDADGHVGHRGRADDVMNAGGYRVSPEEVEAALLAHPQVAEAAAVALPVRDDLSIIAAFVVAPGADAAALDAWCAERLAAYKRPKRIALVDALPRTPTGKLRRRALIEAERPAG